jgi:hypothetical protein
MEHTTHINTASVPENIRTPLLEELRKVFPQMEDGRLMLCSQEPPAFVEILTSIATWKALVGAFVIPYLGTLGKRAADGSIPIIKVGWHHTVKQGGDGLRLLYAGLKRAQQDIGRRLGLQFKYFGAPNVPNFVQFSIELDDEDQFLRQAALIGVSIDGIAKAFDYLNREGFDTSGWVWCVVRDDGFTLQWGMGKPDQHFDFSGTPMGKRDTAQLVS